MIKDVRQLKVYGRYRDNEDTDTGQYPEIKLRGDWLGKAGFKVGDKIKVEVEENKLIIVRQD